MTLNQLREGRLSLPIQLALWLGVLTPIFIGIAGLATAPARDQVKQQQALLVWIEEQGIGTMCPDENPDTQLPGSWQLKLSETATPTNVARLANDLASLNMTVTNISLKNHTGDTSSVVHVVGRCMDHLRGLDLSGSNASLWRLQRWDATKLAQMVEIRLDSLRIQDGALEQICRKIGEAGMDSKPKIPVHGSNISAAEIRQALSLMGCKPIVF